MYNNSLFHKQIQLIGFTIQIHFTLYNINMTFKLCYVSYLIKVVDTTLDRQSL